MPIESTNPNIDVPPGVDFLDATEVEAWVAACEVDKPWRVPMRRRFAKLVGALPKGTRVLELGSGPGFLAECILEACQNVECYTLLDFSEHMLDLSRSRLDRFKAVRFIKADFKQADWYQQLSPPYSAVVAMQAIHEIRHKCHVPGLYRQVRGVLGPSGVLAVCDGIPRDRSVVFQSSLHMTAEEQLEALTSAGFEHVRLEDQIGPTIFVTGRVPK